MPSEKDVKAIAADPQVKVEAKKIEARTIRMQIERLNRIYPRTSLKRPSEDELADMVLSISIEFLAHCCALNDRIVLKLEGENRALKTEIAELTKKLLPAGMGAGDAP